MAGGTGHEHIANLRWRNTESGQTGSSSRAEMVQFVEQNPNQAWAAGPMKSAFLMVVNAAPKYVRTYADGIMSDNLLHLPRF
jgi:hypothetical protein